LRLLHGEGYEIVIGRLDLGRQRRGQLARQLARIDLDQPFSTLDGHAYAGTLLVDQVGLRGKTNEPYRVPGEQQLDRQQRTVGSAENQNFAWHEKLR